MTTIGSTAGASQASLLSSASQNTGGSGADFNMFLKLLTSQMQNQDPLDPMKTSEYTQQLVQYAQVEQSLQQTATLKDMLSRMSSQDMAQAANFIGREARFDSATAGLDAQGGTAAWSYTLDRAASSATATITDGSGKAVQRLTLDPADTDGRIVWDGQMANGVRAPEGPYTLTIAAVDAAGKPVTASINSMGTVKNVALDGNQVMLGMSGVSLPVSSLLAVSAAD